MDSEIGFEMSLIVVEAIRGRCASFTVGFGDIWWTDKLVYFSRPIIDNEGVNSKCHCHRSSLLCVLLYFLPNYIGA